MVVNFGMSSSGYWRFIAIRLLQLILVVIGIGSVLFFLLRLSGDPVAVMLGPDAPEETRLQMRRSLGLDDPLVVQYGRFMKSLLVLDFGDSLRSGEPALSVALRRLPATLELAGAAFAAVALVGVSVGVLVATARHTIFSNALLSLVFAAQAIPGFWLGLLLILVFAVHLRVLPSVGHGTLAHLILPTITLGAFYAARIVRLVRSSVLEASNQDYVRTARGKGLAPGAVLWNHVLRNAWVPIVSVLFLDAAQLIGGAVVTEAVFAWPGIGRQLTTSVLGRDYPVVQAIVFLIAVMVVVLNLLADIIYRLLDPRLEFK